MSWADQRPFVVAEETVFTFKRIRKHFGCVLCSKVFAPGDNARWVMADNDNGTPSFFVCAGCDGPGVMARAKESRDTAVSLAKRWNIYGPDWQPSVL